METLHISSCLTISSDCAFHRTDTRPQTDGFPPRPECARLRPCLHEWAQPREPRAATQAQRPVLAPAHWRQVLCVTPFQVPRPRWTPSLWRTVFLTYSPPFYSPRRARVWAAAGVADGFHAWRLCLRLFARWGKWFVNSPQDIGRFRLEWKMCISIWLKPKEIYI